MRRIIIATVLFTFVFGASFAVDRFESSENFISELKEQSIYLEGNQHELRKLNGKLRNHFTFIGILRQDLKDDLEMSLKSDIRLELKPMNESGLNEVDQYLEKHAPAIVEEHNEKYRHQHVSFMTMLESIDRQ